jgi:hypothetical protein
LQSGRLDGALVPALLKGVSKTYWQAAGSSGGTTHSHSSGIGTVGSMGHPAGGGSDGAVHAVRGLWLSIGRQQQLPSPNSGGGNESSSGGGSGGDGGGGDCFGLLGVNGAGKTTTFKMLTGVVAVCLIACLSAHLPDCLLFELANT